MLYDEWCQIFETKLREAGVRIRERIPDETDGVAYSLQLDDGDKHAVVMVSMQPPYDGHRGDAITQHVIADLRWRISTLH